MINHENPKINFIVFIVLYFIGLINWLFFFNFGNVSLFYEDWYFYFQIYSTWKEALKDFKIPFFITIFSDEVFGEDTGFGSTLFFAKPWSFFQPQIILLYFLSVKNYIIFNYLLFYTILFYSLILWSNYFNLKIISRSFLLLIIIFNGKFFSQTGLGGPQMTFGYMLVPLLFWFFKNSFFEITNSNRFKNIIYFSLFLAFVLAQTDVHIFYQMILVCSLIIIFYPKKYLYFLISILITIILSTWFWAPVYFFGLDNIYNNISEDHWRYYGMFGYGFQNGFAGNTLIPYSKFDSTLISAIKMIYNIFLHYFESMTAHHNAGMPNTHEYNLYINYLGFIMLVSFLFYFLRNTSWKYQISSEKLKLLISCVLIFFIASGPFHYFIIKFIKSFVDFSLVDAVPSRYFYYVFIIICLTSALGYEGFLKKNNSQIVKLLSCLSLLFLLFLLINHSMTWYIQNSFNLSVSKNYDDILEITFHQSEEHDDYKIIVILSYLFSFLSFISLLIYVKGLSIIKNEK